MKDFVEDAPQPGRERDEHSSRPVWMLRQLKSTSTAVHAGYRVHTMPSHALLHMAYAYNMRECLSSMCMLLTVLVHTY